MFNEADKVKKYYADSKGIYEAHASSIASLIKNLIEKEKEKILSITHRAKDENSYLTKAFKEIEGKRKYENPIFQIDDIAGVRIVCYTNTQVEKIKKIVEKNFKHDGGTDKAKDLIETGKLGYISIHYVIMHNESRSILPEYERFKDIKCEIQIRSALQHAWAEIEHQIQYKDNNKDKELYSKFLQLAGLIQIADREFDDIYRMNSKIQANILKDLYISDAETSKESENSTRRLETNGHQKLIESLNSIRQIFGYSPSVLIERGEFSEAKIVYTELIRIQPRLLAHYLGRAKAKILLGELQEARADIEIARGIDPNDRIFLATSQKLERLMDSSSNS